MKRRLHGSDLLDLLLSSEHVGLVLGLLGWEIAAVDGARGRRMVRCAADGARLAILQRGCELRGPRLQPVSLHGLERLASRESLLARGEQERIGLRCGAVERRERLLLLRGGCTGGGRRLRLLGEPRGEVIRCCLCGLELMHCLLCGSELGGRRCGLLHGRLGCRERGAQLGELLLKRCLFGSELRLLRGGCLRALAHGLRALGVGGALLELHAALGGGCRSGLPASGCGAELLLALADEPLAGGGEPGGELVESRCAPRLLGRALCDPLRASLLLLGLVGRGLGSRSLRAGTVQLLGNACTVGREPLARCIHARGGQLCLCLRKPECASDALHDCFGLLRRTLERLAALTGAVFEPALGRRVPIDAKEAREDLAPFLIARPQETGELALGEEHHLRELVGVHAHQGGDLALHLLHALAQRAPVAVAQLPQVHAALVGGGALAPRPRALMLGHPEHPNPPSLHRKLKLNLRLRIEGSEVADDP